MTTVTVSSARAFIDSAELPGFSRDPLAAPAAKAIDYDALKDQAMVVGSEVVSFVKGVSAERREDIVNSALFAQLVANKKVPDRNDVFGWYDAYFQALAQLGWVIQNKTFNGYQEEADGLEAHEAILQVAGVLLGAAPTALAIVTTTIEAMKSMDADNPWITIFDRESRSAKAARFQIALAEESPDGQFMVNLMAFGLEAESSITQILFFKIRKNKVDLRHSSGQVTVNEAVLRDNRDRLKARLAERVAAYIDSADI
jgi:hypothetical protein